MSRGLERFKDFTLVELLVVVAIIAILAALLLPGLSRARDTGKRIACMGNEKQTAIAVMNYADDHKGWMPISNIQSDPRGWKTEIAPYLGIPSSDYTVYPTWISWTKTSYMTKVFKCVSFSDPSGGAGGYGWSGKGTSSAHGCMGYYDGSSSPRVSLSSIKIPGQTITCGDTTDWIFGGTWDYSYVYPPSWQWVGGGSPTLYVGTRHGGGVNMAWADGHVDWKRQAELIKGQKGNCDWYYDPTKG